MTKIVRIDGNVFDDPETRERFALTIKNQMGETEAEILRGAEAIKVRLNLLRLRQIRLGRMLILFQSFTIVTACAAVSQRVPHETVLAFVGLTLAWGLCTILYGFRMIRG